MKKHLAVSAGLAAIIALSLAACAPPHKTGEETNKSDAPVMEVGKGKPVLASVETVAVGTENADAADDPAIWVDGENTARAVVFGTDKKAGLYVYNLDGSVRQHLDGGNPNNVDLREGFIVDGKPLVLVAASDRSPERFGIVLYLMDPQTLQTRYWGVVPVDLVEPYGLCIGKRGSDFVVIIDGTDGQVRQLVVTVGSNGAPRGSVQKKYALESQVEGCVIDDRTGFVYIGEEDKGIWRFSLDPSRNDRLKVASAPSEMLAPDVEGLALLHEGDKTWLMASSQGDSAFAVWRVEGQPEYRGRFSVVTGGGIDAVTGTDGIAAAPGPVGQFKDGLVVVQDDIDVSEGRPGQRQNFKLIDWSSIKSVLNLN